MQDLNQPLFRNKAIPLPSCNKNAKTPKTAQSTPCKCNTGAATRTNTTPIKFYCK
jgi:hypothetical protein